VLNEETACPDLPQRPAPWQLRYQLRFGVGQAEELAGVVDLRRGLP
jgi:hypothetical protein